VKFCQLIASLSAVLPQLNLKKLKLEKLSLALGAKKKDNIDEKILRHASSTFFEFSLSLL